MKILIAAPWLPPRGGGLERYASSLALHLTRAGDDVVILGHAESDIDVELGGVRHVGVKPRWKFSNTPVSWSIHQLARRLVREADVVNVHTPVPGTAELVALAARSAGVPYVVTYHAGRLAGPRGLLAAAARIHAHAGERWLLRGAGARIAVSPYVAERVFGKLPSEVIPPGVDTERFRPISSPVSGRLLFVGPVSRAYAWKGFGVLADAFDQVLNEVEEAHLRVVGEGDLVETYRGRFQGRPVSFLGRLDDAQLAREYSRASLVVLPSTSPAESFGMCLAEANACGRPVVASDIGGIPHLVRHGENGLLVPPGDAHALGRAIATLLRQPTTARTMGEAGQARIVQRHRWDAIAARTADVLEGALRRA